MYEPNWLRCAVMCIAFAAAGVGTADDGGSGPDFPLPTIERILYLSGMGSSLGLHPPTLSMLSNEAPPECRVLCECTCSGDLCVMACRLECELPADPCQTTPQDPPDDQRLASIPDHCI